MSESTAVPTTLAHLVSPTLIAQGEAICRTTQQQVAALNSRDLPTYLRSGLAILQKERADLGVLTVDSADRGAYDAYLAKLDQAITQVLQAVNKLPNLAAANAAFQAAAKPAQQARDLATAMGYTICGNSKPRQLPIANGTATTR